MTKRRTKAEKFADFHKAFKQIRCGEKVKRGGAKDGSIPTHPVVEVDPYLSESFILQECLDWLKHHRIFHNRHDCGSGNFGAGYATYGIKYAGDIIGILPNGIHFEIECKRGSGGRLSKGQQQRWRDVVDNNGVYLVVHGVEELEHYLGDVT